MNLEVDKSRVGKYHDACGIYIRAKVDGKWGSYNIAELTKDSLLELLRERSWHEDVVLHLFGPPPLPEEASYEDVILHFFGYQSEAEEAKLDDLSDEDLDLVIKVLMVSRHHYAMHVAQFGGNAAHAPASILRIARQLEGMLKSRKLTREI